MIKNYSGTENETALIEQSLVAKGFQKVGQCEEKHLMPLQYFKYSHQGSAKSFHGNLTYHIAWAE
jgi:predicted Mrr-cat superfamily restriction endonuclease